LLFLYLGLAVNSMRAARLVFRLDLTFCEVHVFREFPLNAIVPLPANCRFLRSSVFFVNFRFLRNFSVLRFSASCDFPLPAKFTHPAKFAHPADSSASCEWTSCRFSLPANLRCVPLKLLTFTIPWCFGASGLGQRCPLLCHAYCVTSISTRSRNPGPRCECFALCWFPGK